MGKFRKPLLGLAIMLAAFLVFAFIYRAIYSMEEASAYEVNSSELETRLFIATQGSTFKDQLVRQIVDSLKDYPVYIEVRDVASLATSNPDDWEAILVIHTWEYSSPPQVVRQFASSTKGATHIIFFATSGDGDFSIEDVDAISGASDSDQTGRYANQIIEKLRLLLPLTSVDQGHIVH